jgi:hypothetical protein
MSRSEIEQTTREKDFEEHLSNKRGSTINNKNSKSYMSNPDVKEFNKELRKRIFNSTGIGRPYKWSSVEELEEETAKFLELCDRTNTIPTIINLSVWLGCNKDTIYAHANDSNSPFSDFFKNVINLFHGSIESSAIGGGVNPVLYMFLGKNYFGMKDDKNITVAASNNQSTPNAQETAEALQKQLQEEHITEATISEK